ncbi:MAG: multidrug efflux SMR transporter [Gammaproteobacteria bacterium]|jgi:small multidrug resistance pump|nr:multidrug efflux SMR transporter [Gammaproteobacteria bacterium]
MGWFYLAVAIVSEVIATSALKSADGFTRVGPTTLVFIGYIVSFYFFSLSLRTIPVGVMYAVWSGVGIMLMSLIGIFYFRQVMDLAAMVGIAFILVGVGVLTLGSRTIVE